MKSSKEPDPLKPIPAFSGVYLLTDESNRPILLAHAQNIRRAVAHRLTPPDPNEKSKRADLSAVTRRVHWVETFSPFETTWVHYACALELFPKSYREMIGFPPACFIRIDPNAPFPRFTAVDRLRDDGAVYFGPLAASRDADAWIQMLEDAFDLCRYFHILEKAPHGERCAYYDMGKCPAPCDGTVSMEEYRAMIGAAVAFTRGDRASRIDELRGQMQRASTVLEFEKAAMVRRTIERVESTSRQPEFGFMTEEPAWRWLIVQNAARPSRDPGKRRIRPFYVIEGSVEQGEAVSLGEWSSELAAKWIERLSVPSSPAQAVEASGTTRFGETISLVAKFLFQRGHAKGLFLPAGEMTSPQALGEAVRTTFESAEAELPAEIDPST